MLESKRAPIRTYRDLRVYQQSMALLGPIVSSCSGFQSTSGTRSQIRCVDRSVPTNIVEGYGRRSSARDFKHFIGISMGSANEMVVHLEIIGQLEYASPELCDEYVRAYESIGKQLHMLMTNWKSDGRLPTSNIQHPASLRKDSSFQEPGA